ncbi:hypothetical protein [Sutcliffiella horikoshii]|uniref:hypothetical protein n=1 Tax=Sutcliffiella horikoshii TaxID=79883 RepID=UPI003CF5535A
MNEEQLRDLLKACNEFAGSIEKFVNEMMEKLSPLAKKLAEILEEEVDDGDDI